VVGNFSFNVLAAPPSSTPLFGKPAPFRYPLDPSFEEQGWLVIVRQSGDDSRLLCCRTLIGPEQFLHSSALSRRAD